MRKTQKLRTLFNEKDLVRIMGAHNGLSAKLVEEAGFDGVWASGLEVSTSAAVPDASILTMTDYLNRSIEMNDTVDIPIITDCDTGYGNSSNVIRLVQKFESAGIAGISLEDKMFPKVNSLFEGRQELASIGDFVGKILAAKNTQKDSDFMVIARVEALIAGWGMEEAILRAKEYERAGADAILIHHKKPDYGPITEFIERWDSDTPLVLVPTKYPKMNEAEIKKSGKIKLVIYANHGMRSIIPALRKTYAEVFKNGIVDIDSKIAPLSDVFDIQGMLELRESESRFMDKTKQRVRCVIPGAGDYSSEKTFEKILRDRPLLLLDVYGKPLIQRTIENLNSAGIYDVTVVAGHHANMVQLENAKVVTNPEYREKFIVDSLMRARDDFNCRIVTVFSDILFDPVIIQKVIALKHDITIVVDPTLMKQPLVQIQSSKPDLVKAERNPADDLRVVSREDPNKVLQIGKQVSIKDANYEFIGIAGFSKKGIDLFTKLYDEMISTPDKPFQEAKNFHLASLTDMFQALIDRGTPVHIMEVRSGWSEIRTFDDYQSVTEQLASE